EPIAVTVVASAGSGPLAGAPVELAIHRAVPSAGIAPGVLRFEPELLATHGTTGSDGRWTVTLPRELFASETEAILLALVATLGPTGGASASSYELVSVLPAPYSVELLLDRVGFTPGEQITISARVLDRNGIPAVEVPVTATLLDTEGQVVATASAHTGESGILHFSTAPEEDGWYQLVVVAGEGGLQTEATQRIWVAAVGTAALRAGVDVPALSITPDRLYYAPGSEALLALHFPAAGPALLTVERGSVRSARPVELDAGTNVITLPIQSEDQPNIYVSLSRWIEGTRHDHYLGTATAELPVPASGEPLGVTVTPTSDSYSPGAEVTLQVGVLDSGGAPVRAEVSLSVAEAGRPAVVVPTSGLFSAFYSPRPHDVSTANSLAPERQLVTELPSPPQAETAAPNDRAVSTAMPADRVPDTLFWAPALLTDAGGQITVTFTLPQEPGEWLIVARAVTTDTQVGEATARVVTSQPIAIRPILPTFLVQGDVVTVTALVHSYLPQPVSATITLDASGLVVTGSTAARQRTIHLPARGTAHVAWQAAAAESGSAEIAFHATATYRAARLAGRAAARATLPVLPLTLPITSELSGQVDRVAPQAAVTFTLPAATLDLARVDLFLAPSSDPAAYQIYVNDTLWRENSLPAGAREHLVLTHTDTLSPALLLAGENVLRLAIDGDPLYYTATVTTYLTPTAIAEPFASTGAPALRRSYHLPGTDDPLDRVAAGDLVEVRLWLDVPLEISYAVIHDRLPAGLEIVPGSLVEWLPAEGPASAVTPVHGSGEGTVTFHLERLAPGTHRLAYVARATTEGRFIAPPALISPLSSGGAWSHSGTTRLAVTTASQE
ncbi:MAG TPA: alpha-2-macroglobulin family protein, partial [Anaerolineae bacterium]|nr:alpha-2-macroglobulin family protein [Anaerolineae bacterium]